MLYLHTYLLQNDALGGSDLVATGGHNFIVDGSPSGGRDAGRGGMVARAGALGAGRGVDRGQVLSGDEELECPHCLLEDEEEEEEEVCVGEEKLNKLDTVGEITKKHMEEKTRTCGQVQWKRKQGTYGYNRRNDKDTWAQYNRRENN